jgi:Putative transposase
MHLPGCRRRLHQYPGTRADPYLPDLFDERKEIGHQHHNCGDVTLSADEFIGRFLLHVLPSGFHRIRYYGFLANPHRKERLEHGRQLLGMAPPRESPSTPVAPEDYRDRYERLTGHSLRECPVCHRGHMIPLTILAKVRSSPAIQDTS